jgi:hypothetical protein
MPSDIHDAQVERWVAETQAIYAKVTDETWLEWGQEILPHLANKARDVATIETEASLEAEYEAHVNALGDKYVKEQITKEEYDVENKAIELEFEERRRKLSEVADKGKSKVRSTVSVEVEKDEDMEHGDKGAGSKSVEPIDVDRMDVDEAEKSGEAVDATMSQTMGTAGPKTQDDSATVAKTTTKEAGMSKGSKKDRLRFMMPGRHDLRAVSGPVSRYFFYTNSLLIFVVVRSLCGVET